MVYFLCDRSSLATITENTGTSEKIQQRAVEQRRPLQGREVADARQRHQASAGDAVAQVDGMFGADKLIVFAVHHRHRHANSRQILRGIVRLAAHHQAYGGDEGAKSSGVGDKAA